MKRLPLLADFLLFVLLCVSATYWGLQLFRKQDRPVAAPPPQIQAEPRIEAAAGLFGGRPQAEVQATNFQLTGVIAAGPHGVAILVADGKPAAAVGVGQEAAPGVTVKEVHPQYVLLNEGGMVKRVDLPENAKSGAVIPGPLPGAGPAPMQPMPSAPPSMPAPQVNVGGMPPLGNGNQPAPMPQPMQPQPMPQQPPQEQPNPGGIPGGGHPGLRQ